MSIRMLKKFLIVILICLFTGVSVYEVVAERSIATFANTILKLAVKQNQEKSVDTPKNIAVVSDKDKDFSKEMVSDPLSVMEEDKNNSNGLIAADVRLMKMIQDFMQEQKIGNQYNNAPNGIRAYFNIQTASVPMTHPDYEKNRVLAFERAYMSAMSELIQSIAVEVRGEIERKFIENSGSDNRDFDKELRSGKSVIESFFDKIIAFGDAQLSALLNEFGIDASQYDSVPPDQKKVLLRDAYQRVFAANFSKKLSGVTIAENFVAEDESGQGAVGVVVVYSPALQGIAEAIKSNRKPAAAMTGKPIEELLPLDDPKKLHDFFGSRLLFDSDGPVIIAFGHSSNSYTGKHSSMKAKYRSAAYEKASMDALSQLALFLGMSFTAESEREFAEIAEQAVYLRGGDNSVEEIEANKLVDKFFNRARMVTKARLNGAVTISDWYYLTPEGMETVDVVKAYSFNTIDNARKTIQPNTENKPDMLPEQSGDIEDFAKDTFIRPSGMPSQFTGF